MKLARALGLITAVVWVAFARLALGQHEHPAAETGKLGQVDFRISCDAAVRPQFNQAVAMLHSFWYQKASEAFAAIAEKDSACGMAYWGIGMTHYHPLWEAPGPADLKQGREAVEKAKAASSKTRREEEYIAAIEVFYKDSDRVEHASRALAYERAMEQLQARYPDDREAAIFYALAVRATAPPDDKTYAHQKKAGAILEKVFAEQPEHPGVAHYIIHCYDYPPLAGRRYATGTMPARYAVERHRWAEAAALTVPPNTFPGDRYAWTEANIHFARALGASHLGDTEAARRGLQQLASLRDTLSQANEKYWAEQVEIQREITGAWLALAEGKREEALREMRSAADHEDATDKHPVTPGAILPARELLGEMLVELNQPAQAVVEFEATLRTAPNRFNALSGAARAAKLSGDREKAKGYYARLLAICDHADGDRPELRDARAILARK